MLIRLPVFLSGITLVLLTLGGKPVRGQEPMSPGSSLPSTGTSLQRLDGTQVSPNALTGTVGTVFIFWSNQCPWVDQYEGRVQALVSDFQGRGIQFVLVNANDADAWPQESLKASRTQAQEESYRATYVRDPNATFARALGATRTPHVFLFNQNERLVYVGAIDDNPSAAKGVSSTYLRNALEALLKEEKVPASHQKAFGCTLKYPD